MQHLMRDKSIRSRVPEMREYTDVKSKICEWAPMATMVNGGSWGRGYRRRRKHKHVLTDGLDTFVGQDL